jgi:protein-S-isoprenylcysteine O-methyltransferase Ste14
VSGWRQARAIALLPGNVTVAIPALILVFVESPEIGWGLDGAAAALVALAGIALYAAGFAIWLWTVRLFNRIGKGTLAPWDPTSRLVVAGPYRHMRNPMITGVTTLLVGEAVFFGSPWLLAWAALFAIVNQINFLVVEESQLERRFGEEYRVYKRNVPRWLPRRAPWAPA